MLLERAIKDGASVAVGSEAPDSELVLLTALLQKTSLRSTSAFEAAKFSLGSFS